MEVKYLKRFPFDIRLDTFPWIFLHFWLIYNYWNTHFDFYYIGFASLLFGLQIAMFLGTQWNKSVEAFCLYHTTKLESATHALVKGIKPRTEIVELNKDYFTIFHNSYFYDKDKKIFSKAQFPNNLSFGFYQNSNGLTQNEIKGIESKLRNNDMTFPIPTYSELMKEHMLAPFFVFQIFCLVLWMLDEYWQLSIYTLLMLIVFESTTVAQRLQNWNRIKQMRRQSSKIQVFRDKQWSQIDSEQLVAGDIVKFGNQSATIPCDMLLLQGSCQIDESILTGESVPQLKEDISQRESEDCLRMTSDKRHILFGGTTLKGTGNQGIRCFVLQTGWQTKQGKLLNTILYSSDRTSANSKEAFAFIGILLIFALMAVWYINEYTIEDRNPGKLILKSILIITSVVPPELPIELALAVNASIMALQMKQIFSTEPFRLPFAGKATVCCFDKTGTLTDQEYQLKGLQKPQDSSLKPLSLDQMATMIIAGCQSLIEQGVGDPLEVAAFAQTGFRIQGDDIVGQGMSLKIIQRFSFNSELKRMSCVVKSQGQIQGYFVVTKGAPEFLKDIFSQVSTDYDEKVEQLTKQGLRVLSLGYKQIEEFNSPIKREQVETGLTFCGLVAFQSPLKQGSLKVVKELQYSKHKFVMITGDNIQTAAQVAVDLKLGKAPIFFPEKSSSKSNFLCALGNQLQEVIKSNQFESIQVWARTSPTQKEQIIAQWNKTSTTVMCGDGTNDVGGLKRAHVGIALLSKPVIAQPRQQNPMQPTPGLELGDASISAHFTSRSSNLKSVKQVILQGRCALITTYQMYKILALNCLVSAYSLSALYLEGIKFSDTQATVSAIAVSMLFLFVSRSAPLSKLSPHRAPNSLFEFHLIFTIFFQFAVHLVSMILVIQMCKPLLIRSKNWTPDSNYEPDLLNTCIFILRFWVDVVNFLVNYQGLPFMKPLSENGPMVKGIKVLLIFIIACCWNIDPLPEMLELAIFPDVNFSIQLTTILLVDLGLCWGMQRLISYVKYKI